MTREIAQIALELRGSHTKLGRGTRTMLRHSSFVMVSAMKMEGNEKTKGTGAVALTMYLMT